MWYIRAVEHHSAIKKNEIIPATATWMDLEIMILTEKSDRERLISYDAVYIWNLKQDTNEAVCEAESGPRRTDGWLPSGRRVGGVE